MKALPWILVIVVPLSCLPSLFLYLKSGCGDCALFRSHHHGSGQRNASASLKTLATAQADYRANDRDGNRIQDFWREDVSGLYGVLPVGSTEMVKLIEVSVAGADTASIGRSTLGAMGPGQVAVDHYAVLSPKAGYFFCALRHADEKPGALDPNRFAACAYPANYPSSGRLTFILDENNTIYKRDLGRPGPPDVFPDEATLKAKWSKLD